MNKLAQSKSLNDTRAIARKILRDVLGRTKRRNGAVVLALCGDLGSGKTVFTQEIARLLGVAESVISPTFIIERTYKIKKKNFLYLIHIDCYRLRGSAEINALGWSGIVKDPRNIIVVEWAEKIEDVLPKDTTIVCFEHAGESKREIRTKPKLKN